VNEALDAKKNDVAAEQLTALTEALNRAAAALEQ
jgi:hypothetical protein